MPIKKKQPGHLGSLLKKASEELVVKETSVKKVSDHDKIEEFEYRLTLLEKKIQKAIKDPRVDDIVPLLLGGLLTLMRAKGMRPKAREVEDGVITIMDRDEYETD